MCPPAGGAVSEARLGKRPLDRGIAFLVNVLRSVIILWSFYSFSTRLTAIDQAEKIEQGSRGASSWQWEGATRIKVHAPSNKRHRASRTQLPNLVDLNQIALQNLANKARLQRDSTSRTIRRERQH